MTAAAFDTQHDAAGDEEQYLTFSLNNQSYGIPILEVQEIKGWEEVTPIPNSPIYIRGVMNLRGTIVPIIDLRLRFGLQEREYDEFTVIIIVNIRDRLAGLVVDSVSDVINAGEEQHNEAPEFEGQINRKYLQGLVQAEDKLIILLNIDQLAELDEIDVGDAEATED